MSHSTRLLCALALGCSLLATARAADPPLKRTEWAVGDLKREALVHAPASATRTESPVVFVFHGHGGTMKNVAEKQFVIHRHWPEAICVYPQGVPTPGLLTDPEGKRPGWQSNPGDHGDRDLKFFDAMLASLRKDYKIDEKRIYATGHSNGGRFTYLLWAARGDTFAAVAPSGSTAGRLFKDLKPKPCLHLAGEADTLVKYEGQKLTMETVRKINGCDADGKSWDKSGPLTGTTYESKGGTPFVALTHPEGHGFPADDGPKLIVKFFRENPKK
jgi:polyhydroxybutyrate depolymerase